MTGLSSAKEILGVDNAHPYLRLTALPLSEADRTTVI